jgi:hypothetical protein
VHERESARGRGERGTDGSGFGLEHGPFKRLVIQDILTRGKEALDEARGALLRLVHTARCPPPAPLPFAPSSVQRT